MEDQALLAASGPGAVLMYAFIKDGLPRVVSALTGKPSTGNSIPPQRIAKIETRLAVEETKTGALEGTCARLESDITELKTISRNTETGVAKLLERTKDM